MTMTPASSQYFSAVAGDWDSIRSGYFTEAVRQAAIRKAYLRPEMSVADVGAGTGFVSAGLAPLVRQVTALDGSAEMLAVAQENLKAFDNIVYRLAEGGQLPLADASQDAVFANMYLHHIPEPLQAIREMARLLKPGGRLVITDMDSHPYTWFKEEMADVWQGFERQQVRAWFEEAGLVNVIIDCSGESCCAESESAETPVAERAAQVSVFVAVGTKRVIARDAVQAHYAAIAEAGGSCNCSTPASEQTLISIEGISCCSSSSADVSSLISDADLKVLEEIFDPGYSAEERALAPQEAAEFSLGCGNPTALAGLKPGEVVVDIGSGGGLDSFLAARQVGPSGHVIGVDMTVPMLERARASAAKAGLTNVEFRQGHAEALPVDSDSVDVVLSNCVINLVEDKGHVFREIYRVLRPGGHLEVSDMVTSGVIPPDLRGLAEQWGSCVLGALPEQEYLDLIAQAGFSEVRSEHTAASGVVSGVQLFSALVSARKPAK
jgi:arsenite methyltransferase